MRAFHEVRNARLRAVSCSDVFGIVIKNHVSETASRAALVMKVVPGIEVFGGVVLNKAVGGVNPDAVEWMHRVYGSRGKIVWLPTFESDKHVKTLSKPDARGLVVAPGGQVTPEMEAILKIIARENLVLATGHVHPEEIIAVPEPDFTTLPVPLMGPETDDVPSFPPKVRDPLPRRIEPALVSDPNV